MYFEWDPAKSDATEMARGIGFARAAETFAGRLIEWFDDRRPYGETASAHSAKAPILHVVYTKRGDGIRIISARRTNRQEPARWLSSA